jgi:hypothetical protein
MAWKECWQPLPAHQLTHLTLLLMLLAVSAVWWTLRRQLVSVRVLKGAADVEIEFPRRLHRVYELYRHAYEQYVEEGSPPPPVKDPGEEWPEAIEPGWDESDRARVVHR